MKLLKEDLLFIIDLIKDKWDTNLLPVPFEYEYLNNDNLPIDLNNWRKESDLKYLVPKSTYGFRNASLLDPIDLILYTTFIYTLIKDKWKEINKDYIYSDKINIDINNRKFLESDYIWFIDKSLKEWEKQWYVLVTDISDFFSRLYLHDLERGFFSLFWKIPESILSWFLKSRNVNETIWVLPVWPLVSWIISSVALKDVDDFLIHKWVSFIRYVDDYRFFVKNENEAYEILYMFSDYLNKRFNLTLQLSKTHIYSFSEYKLFCNKNYDNIKISEIYSILKSIWDENFLKKLENASSYEEIDKIYEEDISKQEEDKILEIIKEELENEIKSKEINIKRIKKILNTGYRYNILWLHNILYEKETFLKLYILLPNILKYTNIIKWKIISSDLVNIKDFLLNILISNDYHLNKIPYYKICILDFIVNISDILSKNDIKLIVDMFEKENDILVRRLIILILWNLKLEFWFREKKKNYRNFSNWEQRAFIYSFWKCNFSESEKNAFKKSIKWTLWNYEYLLDKFLK